MISVKLLSRIALIAALCFGQMMANVHVVEHIHQDAGEIASASHTGHCHTALPGHTHTAATDHHHHCSSSSHSHSEENDRDATDWAEASCSIYHAFLNLTGPFCTHPIALNVPAKHAVEAIQAFSYHSILAPNHKRIRAPPAVS